MTKSTLIKRTDSKEPIKGYTNSVDGSTVFPDFSYAGVYEMIQKDPVARGAVEAFVDKCVEGDFTILTRDKMSFDVEFQKKLQKDFNFRTDILRRVFLVGKLYNNVFIEIVRGIDGTTVKALNVLNTANVDVITKPNGDLIKLKSKIPNQNTGEFAYWPAKDITWIKFGDRDGGFAPFSLRPLWEILVAKHAVLEFVQWLMKSGQYRSIYSGDNADKIDIDDFLSFLTKVEGNYQKPFVATGALQTKVLRDMKELESIDVLLKYYDSQISINLRIPAVDLGMPETSGRSNADAQSNNFHTHVTSWKTVVADGISNKLFPKMNKGNNIIKFSPNDRFAEKQAFEVLQIMGSLGFTPEAQVEYLADRGIFFNTPNPIKEPEEAQASEVENPRDKDTAPSRIGKGTGEGNKEQKEVTTREDQLKKV